MAIKGEWIRYQDQQGYLARPEHAKGPLPAVVVIQEIWGVDDHIEDVTRRIAAAGYAALAPDLYASGGERPAPLSRERIDEIIACGNRLPPGTFFNPATREAELAKLPGPEQARIRESMGALFGNRDQVAGHIRALRSAVRHLRQEQPETRGQRVACVGFCMGGGLSALLACEEPEISGAAVFYGTSPTADKAAAIQCPVIGFYGENDPRVNATIPEFEQAMANAGKSYERHVYPGAAHGFFNDTRASYNVAAVRDAYARLLAFFSRVLTG